MRTDTFDLPFSGSEPLSKHCSWRGALAGEERVGRQCLALLQVYRDRGPLTDLEAAAVLQVERTTINARRAELRRRGWVQSHGSKVERYGLRNTRWGLTT